MKISHKAFLDLEHALASKTQAEWRAYWRPIGKELVEALKKNDLHKVDQLANSVDTGHLIVQTAQMAKTIVVASMLLGASRITEDISKSHVATHYDAEIVGKAVIQWGYTIARNLGRAVRKQLHHKLNKLEQARKDDLHKITKADDDEPEQLGLRMDFWLPKFEDVVKAAEDLGVSQAEISSSLLVSRMNSFGFLSEAYAAGRERYQINEVLDDATCPVCEVMDGQVFNVSDGIAHATRIMDAEDPDAIASIAPWPSQDSDSVDDLADSDAQDLVDQGLCLPPYHPGCRGIADDADDEESAAPSATSADSATDEAEDLVQPVTPAQLRELLGLVARFITPAAEDYAELVGAGEGEEVEADSLDAGDKKKKQAAKKKKHTHPHPDPDET